jgi:DNA-binding HxlR family transcriptional regulator
MMRNIAERIAGGGATIGSLAADLGVEQDLLLERLFMMERLGFIERNGSCYEPSSTGTSSCPHSTGCSGCGVRWRPEGVCYSLTEKGRRLAGGANDPGWP